MSLFQSPHTEGDLATTVAAREADVTISTAWDAQVAISTAGETEGGSVPTGGPGLSMSTQDPGEGDTPVSSLRDGGHLSGSSRFQTVALQPVGSSLSDLEAESSGDSFSRRWVLYGAGHQVNRETEGKRCIRRSSRGSGSTPKGPDPRLEAFLGRGC